MHMIDTDTQTIVTIPNVLKKIDDKYDHLKNYYTQFAIENVLVRYTTELLSSLSCYSLTFLNIDITCLFHALRFHCSG